MGAATEQEQREAVREVAPELYRRLQKLERGDRRRRKRREEMADAWVRQMRAEIWQELWEEWRQ